MWYTLTSIFPYVIAYTIPLLVTSLGGLYSERSGVVNLGLEGLMLVGSFAAAITIHLLEGLIPSGLLIPIGLLAAVIMGILSSLLHAFASITLKADQIISGTAINMLAAALTVYTARAILGSGNVRVNGIIRKDIPGLANIPVLGPLFFSQSYWSTWLILAILVFSWFLLYKTSFGLRLRACGEHPSAVASAGVNVHKMRYFAVCASGALAGLGGAVILVTYSGEFNGSVDGLGFLALAALIFGQWKPLGILGATFFFGFARTVANVSQVIPSLSIIPPVWLKIFPYMVTLIALVLFSKNSAAPKADGEPY
ncbi:ABC transporter permease [Treponema putidum]|uniref:ABC transporter permease n=1 Tax=Treponema putidum TaxID=221027 RepID=A0AAE9MUZ7_9SPIR|nr:ABC transporter permease [Treponema putidum]AIN94880.1 sugar ABC transporter permease [Treponema putidum]TWI77124.1 nucleoside ABC transporter membrane protein [Treponema putidum]UTY28897.1 ABC transporter permease [Treponema putidum]UTY33748.1 ABC transporter permease [Treponema putidum]